uniref:Uncharacterized protein n=1 Tax=Anguilla anguilla TaxID=7936 RepID=A0A0E9XG81_ANGAN
MFGNLCLKLYFVVIF